MRRVKKNKISSHTLYSIRISVAGIGLVKCAKIYDHFLNEQKWIKWRYIRLCCIFPISKWYVHFTYYSLLFHIQFLAPTKSIYGYVMKNNVCIWWKGWFENYFSSTTTQPNSLKATTLFIISFWLLPSWNWRWKSIFFFFSHLRAICMSINNSLIVRRCGLDDRRIFFQTTVMNNILPFCMMWRKKWMCESFLFGN